MSDNAELPEIRIHLLGGFRVSVSVQSIPSAAWKRRKAATLVKLLALTPGHRLHREWVLETLWPDLDPEAAGNNLHHTLHVARGLVQPRGSVLRLEQDHVSFTPPEAIWTDVEAFETLAARARRSQRVEDYRAALALYSGDLLPEDAYDDWAHERRVSLHGCALALHLELGKLADRGKDTVSAIHALQGALRLEPACEEAHAELMRLYAQSGQRHQALRQYEHLRQALRAELDLDPSVESQTLYDRIRAGDQLTSETAPVAGHSPGAAGRHNLPAPVTSFVGRELELREIQHALITTRMLTLLGIGGAGKTRLALEAAGLLLESYEDGVWAVEFASITDETLVSEAVSQVLPGATDADRPSDASLIDRLQGRHILLLLDNCEHLIDAVARLAATLLARCPRLTILATSREAFGIAGEVTLTVPPLSSPRAGDPTTPDGLLSYDAIRLLVERTCARQPDFALDANNASAAVSICRQLDGMPLAIELAAARGAVLSLHQIAARLHDALGLLTVSSRSVSPRQQSLRAALEWSHDLLADGERIFFRRLAVFARGWTLEAAEQVVTCNPIRPDDVLELLSHLVDRSLVITERTPRGEVRYRFLEPVRQYARERLAASGELDEIQRRHSAHLVSLLEEARLGLTGPDQPAWLHRLDAERDNLRSALLWSETGAPDLGFHLASLVWFPWYMQGHLAEAREWLERMFAVYPESPLPLRILALRGLGATSHVRGDYGGAIASLEEAYAICRDLGDDEQAGRVLNQLAIAVKNAGDYRRATALHEEGLALRRARGDREGIAESLVNLGSLHTAQGDWGRAETFFQEALALEREFGDERMVAIGLNNLGELSLRQGEVARAEPLFREALALGRDLGEVEVIFSCLDGLARHAYSRGRYRRAARLHGAAHAMRQAAGISLHADKRELHDRAVAEVRAAAGKSQFDDAWNEGMAMDPPRAVAYALGSSEPETVRAPLPPAASHEATSALSPREFEVAQLVSHGLTNRQIGRELSIAERTVDTHVSKILRKLDLASRAQLARWVAER